MELFFTCPSCNVQMQIESQFAGHEAQCPECGADISIPPFQLGPNAVVGGFRLEKKLGSGSMGDVYLAEQISMKRKVAVKILPPTMTRDPQSVDRFLHEVQTLARFEHPNIVTAFDAGEDDGTYYLAMSYVNGEDLERIVRRDGPMDEKRALAITVSLAKALKFAWEEHELLHRDIKPENVMIDVHGQIRLMDMGISKSAHEDSNLTMPGVVFGTPHYMSPEQAWSEGALDFRSDLYGLGASLYRLLTGQPPYTGTSQAVFAKLARPDPFPLPRTLREDLSEACDHVIDVMMAPKPEQRYASWDACIADLERVLRGESPVAPRPPRQTNVPEEKAPAAGAVEKTSGGLSQGGMQVITPKAKGRERPKLSLSRTEQMQAPPRPPSPGESAAATESPPAASEKPVLTQVSAAPAQKAVPPVAAQPAAAPAPDRRKQLLKLIAKPLIMAAVLAALAAGAYLLYGVMNPDENPPASAAGGDTSVPATPPTTVKPVTPVVRPPTTTTPPTTPTTPAVKPPPVKPPPTKTYPPVAELQAEVEKLVQQRLDRITAQTVARDLKIAAPWDKPERTSEYLLLQAERQAQEKADREYPLEELARRAADLARNTLGPYRVGMQVSLNLPKERGPSATVRGTLRSITTTTIRVDDRNILVRDLSPEDQARLKPQVAEANVAAFIEARMKELRQKHEEVKQQEIARLSEEWHPANGYVKQEGKWVAKYDLVQNELARRRAEVDQQVRGQIEQQVFSRAGYRLKDGKWQHP